MNKNIKTYLPSLTLCILFASDCISWGMVAEKNSVCLFCGIFEITLFTSCTKPISSMRSASSNTNISRSFREIDKVAGISVLTYLNYALTLCIFFYVYKAMRNFYGQGRMKTFLKYFLFLLSFTILILLLLLAFVLLSFMQV